MEQPYMSLYVYVEINIHMNLKIVKKTNYETS